MTPDLIVFTGDAINSEAGLPNFRRCMKALAAIAPTFAVMGNWEMWWFPEIDLYRDTGVQLLRERSVELELAGVPVTLSGVSVDRQHRIAEVLGPAADQEGGVHVFLHHFAETVGDASKHGVDLQLSGDTHGGGQLRLPLWGEMIRISRMGGYFENELHRIDQTWLYVSRGIGMEGGSVPRIRFNCRPEITLIELAAE